MPTPHRIVTIVVLTAVYVAAAKTGLALASVHASATAVWPPTGIALASLLLFGRWAWPGIFLGAFLANVTTAGTITTSLGIATGNTLEAVLGVLLINRFAGGRDVFARAERIFRYIVLAALGATMVSATVGVTVLAAAGFAEWSRYGSIWLTWWLGDAAGALVVAPFVLLWAMRPRPGWTRPQAVEAALLFGTVVLAAWIIFGGVFAFEYLTVPLLAWAAFRFGPRETSAVIVLLSVIAIVATLNDRGPFLAETQNASLLLFQAFIAIMAIVNLPIAAVVAERKQEQERLRTGQQHFRDLYERERATTEILQRGLLPASLPQMPGLRIAARYAPGMPGAVGGDWYDVVRLPEGRVALVVGDVVGHGPAAAAVMGKLRHAARALAAEGHAPGMLLRRLEGLLDRGEMATILYAELDLADWTVTYASAGHPPAIVRAPDGRTAFLEAAGSPLGSHLAAALDERRVTLHPGTFVILYTDGLVENKTVALAAGLADLAQRIGTPAPSDAADLADRLIAGRPQGVGGDDAALLVVEASRLDAHHLRFVLPALPTAVAEARATLRRWLAEGGVSPRESFDVLVAVGEICSNAVQHAYGLEDAAVDVEARRQGDQVTLIIRDQGMWRAARPPDAGGRGLTVARAMMDRVEIERTETGTRVTLERRVNVGSQV